MDLKSAIRDFQHWQEMAKSPSGFDDYPKESEFLSAALDALEHFAPSEDQISDLLFAISLDYEDENLVEALIASYPDVGAVLARSALGYPEPALRCEMATFLARSGSIEATMLLRRYLQDEDPSVRKHVVVERPGLEPRFTVEIAQEFLASQYWHTELLGLQLLAMVDSASLPAALENLKQRLPVPAGLAALAAEPSLADIKRQLIQEHRRWHPGAEVPTGLTTPTSGRPSLDLHRI